MYVCVWHMHYWVWTQIYECHHTHVEGKGQPWESVLALHLVWYRVSYLLLLCVAGYLTHELLVILLSHLSSPWRSTEVTDSPTCCHIWGPGIRSKILTLAQRAVSPTDPFPRFSLCVLWARFNVRYCLEMNVPECTTHIHTIQHDNITFINKFIESMTSWALNNEEEKMKIFSKNLDLLHNF